MYTAYDVCKLRLILSKEYTWFPEVEQIYIFDKCKK